MTRIIVAFVDGKLKTYETEDKLAVNGPVLVIGMGGADHIAINLAQILWWEVKTSKIERAAGLPAPVRN